MQYSRFRSISINGLVLLLIVIQFSCNCHKSSVSPDAGTAKNLLPGRWSGKIPCDGCPYISVDLNVNANGLYEKYATFEGRDVAPRRTAGNWTIDDGKNPPEDIVLMLTEEGIDASGYIYRNGNLYLRDRKGNPTEWYLQRSTSTGQALDKLIHKWVLAEINGRKTGLKENKPSIPTLELHSLNNKVSGSAGCNNYVGTFQVRERSLFFNQLAVTEMACPDMSLEQEYLATLKSGLNYEIRNDMLILSEKGKTVLVYEVSE